MSIDKKKWQDIAEKYDSKAKWADALLMMNIEDNEDLLSALIELDPKDLLESSATPSRLVGGGSAVNTTWVTGLDTSKISVNHSDEALKKADEALKEARSATEQVDYLAAELGLELSDLEVKLEALEAKSKVSLADVILNLDIDKLPDPQEIVNRVNQAMRHERQTK